MLVLLGRVVGIGIETVEMLVREGRLSLAGSK